MLVILYRVVKETVSITRMRRELRHRGQWGFRLQTGNLHQQWTNMATFLTASHISYSFFLIPFHHSFSFLFLSYSFPFLPVASFLHKCHISFDFAPLATFRLHIILIYTPSDNLLLFFITLYNYIWLSSIQSKIKVIF